MSDSEKFSNGLANTKLHAKLVSDLLVRGHQEVAGMRCGFVDDAITHIDIVCNRLNDLLKLSLPVDKPHISSEIMGMADTMHMVHSDLIEMGLIDKSVPPMMIPEAVASNITTYIGVVDKLKADNTAYSKENLSLVIELQKVYVRETFLKDENEELRAEIKLLHEHLGGIK